MLNVSTFTYLNVYFVVHLALDVFMFGSKITLCQSDVFTDPVLPTCKSFYTVTVIVSNCVDALLKIYCLTIFLIEIEKML